MLSKSYYWSRMRNDTKVAIEDCNTCKKFQANFNLDPKLHSIPVKPTAWHSVGIDIVGPFPTSANKNVVIAID